MSDKQISQKCAFLNKIRYGDEIMADHGFDISVDLALCGAHFMDSSIQQLSKSEVEMTRVS